MKTFINSGGVFSCVETDKEPLGTALYIKSTDMGEYTVTQVNLIEDLGLNIGQSVLMHTNNTDYHVEYFSLIRIS